MCKVLTCTASGGRGAIISQQLFCSCGSPVHTIIPLCLLSRLAWCCWCKRPRQMISYTFSCLPACLPAAQSICPTVLQALVLQLSWYLISSPTIRSHQPTTIRDGWWVDRWMDRKHFFIGFYSFLSKHFNMYLVTMYKCLSMY